MLELRVSISGDDANEDFAARFAATRVALVDFVPPLVPAAVLGLVLCVVFVFDAVFDVVLGVVLDAVFGADFNVVLRAFDGRAVLVATRPASTVLVRVARVLPGRVRAAPADREREFAGECGWPRRLRLDLDVMGELMAML